MEPVRHASLMAPGGLPQLAAGPTAPLLPPSLALGGRAGFTPRLEPLAEEDGDGDEHSAAAAGRDEAGGGTPQPGFPRARLRQPPRWGLTSPSLAALPYGGHLGGVVGVAAPQHASSLLRGAAPPLPPYDDGGLHSQSAGELRYGVGNAPTPPLPAMPHAGGGQAHAPHLSAHATSGGDASVPPSPFKSSARGLDAPLTFFSSEGDLAGDEGDPAAVPALGTGVDPLVEIHFGSPPTASLLDAEARARFASPPELQLLPTAGLGFGEWNGQDLTDAAVPEGPRSSDSTSVPDLMAALMAPGAADPAGDPGDVGMPRPLSDAYLGQVLSMSDLSLADDSSAGLPYEEAVGY